MIYRLNDIRERNNHNNVMSIQKYQKQLLKIVYNATNISHFLK